MAIPLSEPPFDLKDEDALRNWLYQLYYKVTQPEGIDLATVEDAASVEDATGSEDIDAHAALISGVHGVSGALAGTTDTQTFTNKTISGLLNTITGITVALSDITGVTVIADSDVDAVYRIEFGTMGLAVYTIPIWNMDTQGSPSRNPTPTPAIADTKVAAIFAFIISDALNKVDQLVEADDGSGSTVSFSGGAIAAQRSSGGKYDSLSYNDSAIKRGYYFLVYEVA